MQKLIAKVKVWVIIQLIKSLDVSPRHPNRHPILDPEHIDCALTDLRENREEVVGYGFK